MVEPQENYDFSDEEEDWDNEDMMDVVSPYQEVVEYDPFETKSGYKMLTREGIANLQAKMIETMVEENGYSKL
jgi:hypothetical protein